MAHPRRMSVIDVGTNTVRLLTVEADGEDHTILDEFGDVTRLGGGLVSSGAIEPADVEATWLCLKSCLERAREQGVSEIEIAGTEVFRRAANGAAVAAEFSGRAGHLVRVLTAAEEAEAAWLGVMGWSDLIDPNPTIVIDVGGGSTEVILGEGILLEAARSIPVGALTTTDQWLTTDPAGPRPVERARRGLAAELAGLSSLPVPRGGELSAIAVGGSACAIGAWIGRVAPYDPGTVHGRMVELEGLAGAVSQWQNMSLADRMARGQMGEGRARVLLGGALVLEGVLKVLDLPGFRVSIYGLRHGLIIQRLLAA